MRFSSMKKSVANEKACLMRRIALIGQKPGLALFLFFAAFYYFTNAGWFKGGDEAYMIRVAKQMAAKGQVGFSKGELPDDPETIDFLARGPDGRYYTKWGLGQSLVELPFLWIHQVFREPPLPSRVDQERAYAVSEFMTLILCPSILSALGCVLIYLFALRLKNSKRISILLSLLYGVATMIWPYSKSLMSEATLNVAILSGVYGASSYVVKPSKARLAAAGACLGFALITKITSLLIAVTVVFYLLATCRRRTTLRDIVLFFGTPFLAFAGIQLWHNFIRYGEIWRFGYDAGWGALGFCTPLYVGLWGLFLSPGKSFFLYSPLAFLALLSVNKFFRRNKAEALLFLSIVIVYTLLHARWCLWAGDWAWGPRFLLVIIPFLILPCGVVLEEWGGRSRHARIALTALIAFSIWIQVLGCAIHPYSFIVTRNSVVNKLLSSNLHRYSYADSYSENALTNFSPMFSHLAGNWWLLKHMILDYDLWRDVPWKPIGAFDLERPIWVRGNRTIPFWWPVGIPLLAPSSRHWVIPVAAANFLAVLWFGLRLMRLFRNCNREQAPAPPYLLLIDPRFQEKDN
jgi:hypothetical protein